MPLTVSRGSKQCLPREFPCHAISHLPFLLVRTPHTTWLWLSSEASKPEGGALGTHHGSSVNISDLGLGRGALGGGPRPRWGVPRAGPALTVGAAGPLWMRQARAAGVWCPQWRLRAWHAGVGAMGREQFSPSVSL